MDLAQLTQRVNGLWNMLTNGGRIQVSEIKGPVPSTNGVTVTAALQSNAGNPTGQVLVTWTGFNFTFSPLKEYRIYRSLQATVHGDKIFMGTAPSSGYTDVDAQVGKTCYWGVSAVNVAAQESAIAWSAGVQVLQTVPPTAPVSNPVAVAYQNRVDVSWGASADAAVVKYLIQKSTNGGTTWSTYWYSISASTSDNIFGVSNAAILLYRYRVAAVTATGGQSAWVTSAAPSVTNYPNYTPLAIDIKGSIDGRTCSLYWAPNPTALVVARYELQISPDNNNWYACDPANFGIDPWTPTTLNAVWQTKDLAVSFRLSLGVSGSFKVTKTWYFRVRAVSETNETGNFGTVLTLIATPVQSGDIAQNAITQGQMDLSAYLSAAPINQGLIAHWSFDDLPDYPDDPTGTAWLLKNASYAGTGYGLWTVDISPYKGQVVLIISKARKVSGARKPVLYLYNSDRTWSQNTGDSHDSLEFTTAVWTVYIPNDSKSYYASYYGFPNGADTYAIEIDFCYIGIGGYLNPAKDTSGAGHLATIDSRVYAVNGVNGKSLTCTNGYGVGSAKKISRSGACTLSFWRNWNGTLGSFDRPIVAITDHINGADGGIGIFYGWGSDLYLYGNNFYNGIIQKSDQIGWRHWVIVYDTSYTQVYIDGVLVYNGGAYQLPLVSANICVGKSVRGGNSNATFDEVRIYNRALSEAEIRYLYTNPGGPVPALFGAERIVAGSITANEIAAKTITAAEIKADTITAIEIAAKTITAAKIAAGTITAEEIAADTITANKIKVAEIAAQSAFIAALASQVIKSQEHDTITTGTRTKIDLLNAQILLQTLLAGSLKLEVKLTSVGLEGFYSGSRVLFLDAATGDITLGKYGTGKGLKFTNSTSLLEVLGDITANKLYVDSIIFKSIYGGSTVFLTYLGSLSSNPLPRVEISPATTSGVWSKKFFKKYTNGEGTTALFYSNWATAFLAKGSGSIWCYMRGAYYATIQAYLCVAVFDASGNELSRSGQITLTTTPTDYQFQVNISAGQYVTPIFMANSTSLLAVWTKCEYASSQNPGELYVELCVPRLI